MTVSNRAGYKVTLHKSNPFDLYAIGYPLYMLYLWASSFCSRSKDYHQPWDQGYHSADTRPELRVLSINKVGFFFRVFFKSLLYKHLPGGEKKNNSISKKASLQNTAKFQTSRVLNTNNHKTTAMAQCSKFTITIYQIISYTKS